MPPLWPREPDRNDPDFRRFGDRVNFAFHVALFCATDSFLWFLSTLKGWDNSLRLTQFSVAWVLGVVAHGVYVFKIATYPGAIGTKALKKKDLEKMTGMQEFDSAETGDP